MGSGGVAVCVWPHVCVNVFTYVCVYHKRKKEKKRKNVVVTPFFGHRLNFSFRRFILCDNIHYLQGSEKEMQFSFLTKEISTIKIIQFHEVFSHLTK